MNYYFYAVYNRKIYKTMLYNGYTKKEAIALYRKECGLKYKRDVKFYNQIGGSRFL